MINISRCLLTSSNTHAAKDTLQRQRDVTILEQNSLSVTQNNKKSISQGSDQQLHVITLECSHRRIPTDDRVFYLS